MAVELARAALADHPDEREISLLAISVSHLVTEPVLQMELPARPAGLRPPARCPRRRRAAGRSIGRWTACASGSAGRPSGTRPVAFTADTSVPDEFRRLAEHDDADDSDGTHGACPLDSQRDP